MARDESSEAKRRVAVDDDIPFMHDIRMSARENQLSEPNRLATGRLAECWSSLRDSVFC
jgi:hypothetical protein